MPQAYQPIELKKAQDAQTHRRQKYKENFDKTSKQMEQLEIGGKVLMQNPITLRWDAEGIVEEARESGRSYLVRKKDGATYIRNRKFLRKIEEFAEADKMNDTPAPILRRSKRLQAKSVSFNF